MGTTVQIGHSVGAKNLERNKRIVANTIVVFSSITVLVTTILYFYTDEIVKIMLTPVKALKETSSYLKICFLGIPFIIAYNVVASVYRGAGDSKRPLLFIAFACLVNIAVDFWFIGGLRMGAAGAAYGTVVGQAACVFVSLVFLPKLDLGMRFRFKDVKFTPKESASILKVGLPIAIQDGLVQIAFIVITIIANNRGLIDSVSVGIVEKLISFMFIAPSAFLSAISAFTAQNMGAQKEERARECLKFGLLVTIVWGMLCCVSCQVIPNSLISLFRYEPKIIAAASAYLRAYSFDCFIAAIHFCFSGYFCGLQKSWISFFHNILSVALVRIPGSYFASLCFPTTLYPMGLAAPLGSALSVVICIVFYIYYNKKLKRPSKFYSIIK